MDDARITAALRDAANTKTIVIGAGTLQAVADVFTQSFGVQPAVVVADDHTWEVAGAAV